MKSKPDRFNTATPKAIASLRKLIEEIGYDGHTIWKADVLDSFPPALRERFTKTHFSGKHPKDMISNKNQVVVDQVKGVYGLTVLRAIAEDLGLKYEVKMGRGFQASAITSVINSHLSKL